MEVPLVQSSYMLTFFVVKQTNLIIHFSCIVVWMIMVLYFKIVRSVGLLCTGLNNGRPGAMARHAPSFEILFWPIWSIRIICSVHKILVQSTERCLAKSVLHPALRFPCIALVPFTPLWRSFAWPIIVSPLITWHVCRSLRGFRRRTFVIGCCNSLPWPNEWMLFIVFPLWTYSSFQMDVLDPFFVRKWKLGCLGTTKSNEN